MNTRITLLLSFFAAISSCTIEKRLYTKGFHVEFRKSLRESDPHREVQSINEPKSIENKLEEIRPDSIIDPSVVIQEEKEEVISDNTNENSIPVIKSVSRKSKMKSPIHRIRTGVFIHMHFSESLMNKSLKKNQYKRSVNRSRDFDWGEFFEWVLIVGAIIGFVFLLSAMPGVSFVEALIGVLVVILIAFLLALLISSALGNFEWFWSGR